MVAGRDFLGPYRLIRLIRAGNSSQVWEASREAGGDRLALKVLLPEQLNNKLAIEHLRHEAEVGKQLHNEHVIEIFEFSNKSELPYVAMELFNAKNLKQALRENPESVAYHAQEIIKQAALGLQYLHDQGWVHCDVKPDNFLVLDSQVKLIDFSIAQRQKKGGIAGLLDGLTGRGKVQGTRSYMSPEQIRGKALGPTSDVYSFGCMLYEVFAGKPPFSGNNPNDLLNKHLKSPPPTILTSNSRVSQEFADLVIQMMDKDPAKRPESMGRFLTMLERARCYRPGMRPPAPETEAAESGSANDEV